jgi:hypothetical protein
LYSGGARLTLCFGLLGCWSRGSRRLRDWRVSGCWFSGGRRQTRRGRIQTGNQSVVIARWLRSRLRQARKDSLYAVQGDQYLADDVRRGGQSAITQLAQHVLARMGNPLQPWQPEKTTRSFDRVHHAKNQP